MKPPEMRMLNKAWDDTDIETKESPLNALVRKHLADHHQDYELAVPPIVKDINKSRDLTERAIWVAVRYLARLEVRNFRDNMKTSLQNIASVKTPNELIVVAKSNPIKIQPIKESRQLKNDRILTESGRWYNWPLPGNRGPIGEADRKIMDSVDEFYEGQEKGMRHNRATYNEIRQKLHGNKKVRQVCSAAEVARVLMGLTK